MIPPRAVATCTIGLAAIVSACSRVDSHPPFVAVQCGRACIVGNQNGGPPGDSGVAPESDAAASTVTFQGAVGYFTDTRFSATSAYTAPGSLTVYASPSVTGAFSDGSFALEVTGASDPVWALVQPARGTDAGASSAIPVLPTFEPLSPAVPNVDLTLVPSNVLSEIYGQLTLPQAVDATRAQVVMRFVSSGVALSGASIQPVPAGATVAYDTSGAYSDIATATGPSGTALLANLPAVPLPGADMQISYIAPGRTGAITVRAAEGTVTLLVVSLTP